MSYSGRGFVGESNQSLNFWTLPGDHVSLIHENQQCARITALLKLKLGQSADGVPCLFGALPVGVTDDAAKALACSIVSRRAPNERLLAEWHSRAIDGATNVLTLADERVLASILQNVGTPDDPAQDAHLHGLVAEAIWFSVVSDSDVGLGIPMRVEGHDWSVTDPGGDGLTIYIGADGTFHFRLWESKYHGHAAPLKTTVDNACKQVAERALAYLARFSLVSQHLADNVPLASFYGRLPELWVNRDAAAGVGIVLGTNGLGKQDELFDSLTGHFHLPTHQHQGQLNVVGDYKALASAVRQVLWAGCGLWTER